MVLLPEEELFVGVVVEVRGKSIALHFSQADDKVAEARCSPAVGSKLRQRAAAFGEVGDARSRLWWRRAAGLQAVTLSTPPLRVDFALSHTQFSATPVGIGIVCVK